MPPRPPRDGPAKFFNEDLVRQVAIPHSIAIVLRCWHDAEEIPPSAQQHEDPLLRPLKRGEIGVSHLPTGKREIVLEPDFVIVDRSFHVGDVCKRSVNDVRSGIVLRSEVSARLAHAITGVALKDPVPSNKLRPSVDYFVGDFVLCDNWVGQIEEVFEENTVQTGNGQHLVKLPQLGAAFGVGDKGIDILPPAPEVPGIMGYIARTLRSSIASHNDLVVKVQPIVVAITWLAVNQKLSSAEAATIQRPQRFWSGTDLSRLVLVHNRSEEVVRVGERVYFKNQAEAQAMGVMPTTHGRRTDNDSTAHVEVWDLIVHETQTTVKILWQDGTVEENVLAKDLIPYLNVDESECWPGDHVLWKSEDEERVGVVQTASAEGRTASVRWCQTPATSSVAGPAEVVSVLELDPHGYSNDTAEAGASSSTDMFGVRRGEFVFIHGEGTTNGLELPRVPKIGEVEPWVREASGFDGQDLQGWRREMAEIGWKKAGESAKPTVVPMHGSADAIDWFGEVSELRPDGLIEVTLPSMTRLNVPLQRLTLLQDGLDATVEDMWGDEYEDDGSFSGDEADGDEAMEIEYEDPRDADNASQGSWETMPEDEERAADWDDGDADKMDVEAAPTTSGTPELRTPPAPTPAQTQSPLLAPQAATPEVRTPSPAPVPQSSGSKPTGRQAALFDAEDVNEVWQRFAVLSSAPPDHAFYGTPIQQPSKTFTSRINKEFRVLSQNLPETILVRAYEDRSDLIRSLIIGPENTPYEDAPFVIDWMLDSDFPQTPPKAHFLSWTNGNGRVNPNLYEEGKVCLSILGTWAGEASESWSAAKSSLFQVFLSIQGLVLVKEPWFCEPAYEKLRGTAEGTVNSRLYSERAYVLSRGFIRRALEIPLSGLEDEIHWLYYRRGLLDKALDDARALIDKSKDVLEDKPLTVVEDDLAVPRLTAGGVITLSRTLVKLQGLHDVWHAAHPA
ncbi:hypothetical protein BKA62DRAFT_631682 [Auriculariales sp. MPI-PUGE-AT-0066]|nr:hypothetical protein BKA62DRAFT_631682 [Auriculariales sp. MPI-PUGE-AT-0066]